eukprot:c9729_g1_i1.p1 GENE.c9729_g1_i1~~c9729_g1_i1.p1  ORF type:complete len:404 (-),score=84.97 c9729_g1_i1:81-1250(-)
MEHERLVSEDTHYDPILVTHTTKSKLLISRSSLPLITLFLAACSITIVMIATQDLTNLKNFESVLPSAAPPPLPKRIACVGDSITVGDMTFSSSRTPLHGSDTSHKFRGSYPGTLTHSLLQTLPNSSFEVMSLAWKGRTTMKPEHLTNNFHGCGPHERTCSYWDMPGFDQLAEFDPDAVVILLGTNDSKDKEHVLTDYFESDFMAVLEQAGCGFNTTYHRQCFVVLPPPVFGLKAFTRYYISEPSLKQIIRPTILRAVQNITDYINNNNADQNYNYDDSDDNTASPLHKPPRSHLHVVDTGKLFEANSERYMGWNASSESYIAGITQVDGVHPLAAGSRVIGWCVYNHMVRVYGELPGLPELVLQGMFDPTDSQHTQDLADIRLVDEYC